MFYVGQQATADVDELYWVDLSGSAPTAPRKLNGLLSAGINVTRAGFTADSSKVWYVAGGSLYLVDLPTTGAIGQLVLSSYSSFEFQP